MERAISCERVPEGRRLEAFQEAVDLALKSLVSRYPRVQGFSVKLYKNLPAFAPAYYIGTLDRVQVRRGWSFGLDALLDGTAKPMREIELAVVRASRLHSLVRAMSMLISLLAACTGSAIVAVGFVAHCEWLWEGGLQAVKELGIREAIVLGITAAALIVVLIALLIGLTAHLIDVSLSFMFGAYLYVSGKGASRQELHEALEAIGDEIEHALGQLASVRAAAGNLPAELKETTPITSRSEANDCAAKGLSLEYSCTKAGAVLKVVHCECCGAAYGYQLKRSARGEGSSFLSLDDEGAAARAASRAEVELRDKLERGVDAVPCPACGWYQQDMLLKARSKHRYGMLYTGLCLTIGLIPVAVIGVVINSEFGWNTDGAIPWPILLGGLFFCLMIGLGLILAKFVLAATYDPNTQDVEMRKQIGQARAWLREDFDKVSPAQQEDNPDKTGGK
jgi:hypothetical protein